MTNSIDNVRTTTEGPGRTARQLVGLERSYSCEGCGGEHRSWSRLRACPDCGRRFVAAVIRRAALA